MTDMRKLLEETRARRPKVIRHELTPAETREAIREAGIDFKQNEMIPIGSPVHFVDPFTNKQAILLHPIDWAWVEYYEHPDIAHSLAMDWIEKRIEEMGDNAVRKLNRMYVDPEIGK